MRKSAFWRIYTQFFSIGVLLAYITKKASFLWNEALNMLNNNYAIFSTWL